MVDRYIFVFVYVYVYIKENATVNIDINKLVSGYIRKNKSTCLKIKICMYFMYLFIGIFKQFKYHC